MADYFEAEEFTWTSRYLKHITVLLHDLEHVQDDLHKIVLLPRENSSCVLIVEGRYPWTMYDIEKPAQTCEALRCRREQVNRKQVEGVSVSYLNRALRNTILDRTEGVLTEAH